MTQEYDDTKTSKKKIAVNMGVLLSGFVCTWAGIQLYAKVHKTLGLFIAISGPVFIGYAIYRSTQAAKKYAPDLKRKFDTIIPILQIIGGVTLVLLWLVAFFFYRKHLGEMTIELGLGLFLISYYVRFLLKKRKMKLVVAGSKVTGTINQETPPHIVKRWLILFSVVLSLFILVSLVARSTGGKIFLLHVAFKFIPPEICSQLPDEHKRMNCYFMVASATKDWSLCMNIADNTNQLGCFTNVVERLGTPNICENLNNRMDIDICYFVVAANLGNQTICDHMSTELNKSKCIANVHNKKK